MAKVGIIGAGLAGLTLASRLAGTADVTLFEKARGVSGRMATRRAEPFSFDHGAQYFTARSEPFQDFIAPYVERGLLADWEPHFLMMEAGKAPFTADKHGPHYVGVPHMNAFLKAVAEPFSILLECQIARIEPGEDGVVLLDRDGEQHGPFDWVISTAPAAQSHQLKPHAFSGHDALDTARVMGCFTLMLGYHRTLSPEFDGLFVEGSPVGWIANNASKPGREGPASIVVQSTNEWAEAHMENDPDEVARTLLEEASNLTGLDLVRPDHQDLHRWRYAFVTKTAGHPYLIDPGHRLAACGDWCIDGRVESAFLSADKLAHALSDHL